MALTIAQSQLAEAQALSDQGQVGAAWASLAQDGDSYAAAAYFKFGPSSTPAVRPGDGTLSARGECPRLALLTGRLQKLNHPSARRSRMK
jgi:hypothetical protein